MRTILTILGCALPAAVFAAPQAPKDAQGKPTGPGALPAKGDNGQMGGIFGMGGLSMSSMSSMGGSGGASLLATGSESPKGMGADNSGGSGAYNAHYVSDDTLPNHTIYAPKTPPPAEVKLPVIVWGNGGCIANGASFANFLTEIASHGYLILANGPSGSAPKGSAPKGGASGGAPKGSSAPKSSSGGGLLGGLMGGGTKVSDLTASVDWVMGGKGAKYGNIDTTKIATAGQSCGGLEAYSASYHDDRIKLTVLFNSGVLDNAKTYLLSELKVPVAYFLGGPKDIAYANGVRDYGNLPKGLPAVLASLDTGHVGTYFAKQGGKFGKAAVMYFDWQLKGDKAKGAAFTDLQNSELIKEHWNISSKNWG